MWLQSSAGKEGVNRSGRDGDKLDEEIKALNKQAFDEKIRLYEEQHTTLGQQLEVMEAEANALEASRKEAENKAKDSKEVSKTAKENAKKAKDEVGRIREGTAAERAARDDSKKQREQAGKMLGKGGKAMRFIEGGGAANLIATAPMLGAQASQFMDADNRTGKAAVEGSSMAVSYAATGAQMGAMAGPWGAAIGGIAGATMGIKGLADGLVKAQIQENGARVKKELEEVGEALNKVQSSGQKYLESVNKMNDMFKKPIDANPEDLAKLQRKMAESITDIPDKFRAQFIAASGDAERIKEVFGEITENLQRDKADLEAATKGFELQEKFAGEFFDRALFDEGDSNADRQRIEQNVASQIRSGGVNQQAVIDAINAGKLDLNNINNFQDIDSSFLGEEFSAFVSTLDSADMSEYTVRIKDYFRELKRGSDASKEASKVLKERRKLEEAYALKLNNLRSELASFSATVGISIDILKDKAKTFDEMVRNAQSFNIARAQEFQKGFTERAGAFQTEEGKASSAAQTRAQGIRAKFLKQQQEATAKAAFAALEIPLRKFTEASKKTNDILSKRDQAGRSKELEAQFKRVANSQETLLPVVQKSIKIMANSDNKLEDLKSVSSEIKQASLDAGYTQEEAQALTSNILKQLEKEEENLANKLSLMIQQQDQELVLSAIQAENQKRMIQQTKELKFAGGAGAFDSQGKTVFSQGFDKIANVLGSQLKSLYSGDQVDQGRADFELLKLIRESMPLVDLQNNPAAMGLAGNAMVARAQDIEGQIFMAQRAMSLRTSPEEARAAFEGVDAYDLAAKQITSELKLENMSEDIAEMNKNSKILNVLIGNQSQDLYGQNVKAFDAALKANGLGDLSEASKKHAMITGSLGKVTQEGTILLDKDLLKVDSSVLLVNTSIKNLQTNLGASLAGYQAEIQEAFKRQRQVQEEMEQTQNVQDVAVDVRSAFSQIEGADTTMKEGDKKREAAEKEAEKKLATSVPLKDLEKFLMSDKNPPRAAGGNPGIWESAASSMITALRGGQMMGRMTPEEIASYESQPVTLKEAVGYYQSAQLLNFSDEQKRLLKEIVVTLGQKGGVDGLALLEQSKDVRPDSELLQGAKAAMSGVSGGLIRWGLEEIIPVAAPTQKEAIAGNMLGDDLTKKIAAQYVNREATDASYDRGATVDKRREAINRASQGLALASQKLTGRNEVYDVKTAGVMKMSDLDPAQVNVAKEYRQASKDVQEAIGEIPLENKKLIIDLQTALDKNRGSVGAEQSIQDGLEPVEIAQAIESFRVDSSRNSADLESAVASKLGIALRSNQITDEEFKKLTDLFSKFAEARDKRREIDIKGFQKNTTPKQETQKPIETGSLDTDIQTVASSSKNLSGAMDDLTILMNKSHDDWNKEWYLSSVIPASFAVSTSLEGLAAIVDKSKGDVKAVDWKNAGVAITGVAK